MGSKRKNYSAKFKLQVVLELVMGKKTYAQLMSEYGIHATQINNWRHQFTENAEKIFSDKRNKETKEADKDKVIEGLYKKVGQLTIERDWLEKKIGELPDIFSGLHQFSASMKKRNGSQ